MHLPRLKVKVVYCKNACHDRLCHIGCRTSKAVEAVVYNPYPLHHVYQLPDFCVALFYLEEDVDRWLRLVATSRLRRYSFMI
jgi:hypothetical protein